MANKTPVWYEAGFGVYGGDDTIHHLYTDGSGNILTLDKTSAANTVFEVKNAGEARIRSVTGASSPALEIDGLSSQTFLKVDDDENSDHILSVYKEIEDIPTNAWSVNFKLRDSGTPQNADVALRLVHDIQTNSPPQGANLLSMGYTNATEVYQELFRFEQSGDAYLMGSSGADLLWDTDGGGSIGGSAANRPANVYADTSMVGGGTVVQAQTVQLGPAADNDKTLTALQSATSPYIKYVNGSGKWQFSNDGVTPLDFGTSAVLSWDDLYALDQSLTIDGSVLTFTQTATTGTAFKVTRNLSSSNTDSPIMDVTNAGSSDDQDALYISQAGQGSVATDVLGYGLKVEPKYNNSRGVLVYANDSVGTDTYMYAYFDSQGIGVDEYRWILTQRGEFTLNPKATAFSTGTSHVTLTRDADLANAYEDTWFFSIDDRERDKSAFSVAYSGLVNINLDLDGTVSSFDSLNVRNSSTDASSTLFQFQTGVFSGAATDRFTLYNRGELALVNAADCTRSAFSITQSTTDQTALEITGATDSSNPLVTVDSTAAIDDQSAMAVVGRSVFSATTATNLGTSGSYKVLRATLASTGTGLAAGDAYYGLEVSASFDADDDSTSEWYGVYAVGAGTAGSTNRTAFGTGGSWDNLLEGEGKIAQNFTSPTAWTGANYLLYTNYDSGGQTSGPTLTGHYISMVDHASDKSGQVYYGVKLETAQNQATSTKYAVHVDNNFRYGFYSHAGEHYLERTNTEWTGLGFPVLHVKNLNSATDTAGAIQAEINQTSSSIYAVAMDNIANVSATEGTRYHLGFTENKTNRRILPIEAAVPHASGLSTGANYRYRGGGTSDYWETETVADIRYLTYPLKLPHGCTLATVEVYQYGGGGTATGTDLPYIGLYQKAYGSSAGTLVGSLAYAASTGAVTITLSPSQTLDNTTYEYQIRYRNVITGAIATSKVYSFRVTYTIIDLGAAPGF